MVERRCKACGRPFRYAPSKDMRRSNRQYCSNACRYAKPPKMAEAERVYGRPVGDLLLEWLNSGVTVEAAAGRLGVHKQALLSWMRRLGIQRQVRWVRKGVGALG